MDRLILFTCPRLGMNVQHWLAGGACDDEEAKDTLVGVPCPACGSVHFIHSQTGKLLAHQGGKAAASPPHAVRAQRGS